MAKKRKTVKRKSPVKKAVKRPAKINGLKKQANALLARANKLQKKFEIEQKIKALKASLKR